MSSLASSTLSCSATCNSSSNILCQCCTKHYCNRHLKKHQENLMKTMEKVFKYHDKIQRSIVNDTKNYLNHPLMKKIDQWESESIIKIQQTANEIRKQFQHVFTKHTNEMNKIFMQISQELKQARIENNLIENDTKIWLEKLHEFKQDFHTPKTINIRHYENNNQEFINKIKLSQLSIDCDGEKIVFINQSTSLIHEIDISTIKCPFPWVLYIGLHGADDQIRLLLA